MATRFVFRLRINDGDYSLMEFVLKHCLDSVDLRRATDGEQAVTFLKSSATSIDLPRPNLVLLDVNIPRMSGFDVLEFIKSQDFIRDVPVVMFTSSRDAREKRKAPALGAEEFVKKPTNLDGMVKVLNQICAKHLDGNAAAI
jgi:two-component system, chemotaxis family, response regulator Rcp1